MAWHYIKGNKGQALPRMIVFLDTETLRDCTDTENKVFAERFRLGVAIAGRWENGKLTRRKVVKFTSAELFWKWLFSLCKPRQTLWLVAHNLLFDIKVLGFQSLFSESQVVLDKPRSNRKDATAPEPQQSSKPLAVLESPPTILGVRHLESGGRMVWVDTLNWFKCKLEVLGEACDLPKLPMPDRSESDETWFNYCKRDAEILEATFCRLVKFVSDNDLGIFRFTAAGQAWAAFRHGRMPSPICTHDNADAKKIERLGYFGGRIECFKMGRVAGDVYYVDVNSLYPSVMRNRFYPNKLRHYEIRPDLIPEPPSVNPWCCIATVQVETWDYTYPVRTEKGVIYPHGTYVTTLAGPELLHAVDSGHVKAWGSWSAYHMDKIFKRYVEDLQRMRDHYRQTEDPLYESFCKLLSNSLYGKFGQLAPVWEHTDNEIASEPWTSWVVTNCVSNVRTEYRSVGWDVFRNAGRAERSKSFPAIAAFVTSYARLRMYNLIQIAQRKNVYYIGTDALMVSEAGLTNLMALGEIDQHKLGKMKVQAKADNLEIKGCGHYKIGQKDILSGRQIDAITDGNGGWKAYEFGGSADLFRNVLWDDVRVSLTAKQSRGEYWKGTVDEQGNIKPHRLTERLTVAGIEGLRR